MGLFCFSFWCSSVALYRPRPNLTVAENIYETFSPISFIDSVRFVIQSDWYFMIGMGCAMNLETVMLRGDKKYIEV